MKDLNESKRAFDKSYADLQITLHEFHRWMKDFVKKYGTKTVSKTKIRKDIMKAKDWISENELRKIYDYTCRMGYTNELYEDYTAFERRFKRCMENTGVPHIIYDNEDKAESKDEETETS